MTIMARIKKMLRFKRSLLEAVYPTECKHSYFNAFLRWLDDHYPEFVHLGVQDDLGMFTGLTAEDVPLDWVTGVSIQREKQSIEQLDENMKVETFTMLLRTKLWDGLVFMSDRTCLQCGEHSLMGMVQTVGAEEVYYECDRCGRQYDLALKTMVFQPRKPASLEALSKVGILNDSD